METHQPPFTYDRAHTHEDIEIEADRGMLGVCGDRGLTSVPFTNLHAADEATLPAVKVQIARGCADRYAQSENAKCEDLRARVLEKHFGTWVNRREDRNEVVAGVSYQYRGCSDGVWICGGGGADGADVVTDNNANRRGR